jgi:hypothetical protein
MTPTEIEALGDERRVTYWRPSIPGQICTHCGVTYTAHKKGQTFCGKSCSQSYRAAERARLTHTERTCPHCKTKWRARAKNPSNYCSKKCLRADQEAARQRDCIICGASFTLRKAGSPAKTCSETCRSELQASVQSGRKHSPETIAKRAAAVKAALADPEVRKRQTEATRAARARWLANPDNAARFAHEASERMKRRHADPEWQTVRDARSSRVMKGNWEKHRDAFTAISVERYARGEGIASEEAKARKAVASKWIMKRAQEALHAETDYNLVYAEVQAELRNAHPYDPNTDDYYEYCKKLGTLVVSDPRCMSIANSFLATAIPHYAAEWQKRKATATA